MSHDATTPRLVYKGPTDDTAETATATDPDDLAAKLKAGYRLKRNPKNEPVEVPGAEIKVPAQSLKVDPKPPAPAKDAKK